jgi:hypothetical protein
VQSDAAVAARIGAQNRLCNAARSEAELGKLAARLTRRAFAPPYYNKQVQTQYDVIKRITRVMAARIPLCGTRAEICVTYNSRIY